MAPHRTLKDSNEWADSRGNRLELCVVEELDSEGTESAAAIIVFGGFSLCREHFDKVTNLIKDGVPMGQIVNKMMTEGLDT